MSRHPIPFATAVLAACLAAGCATDTPGDSEVKPERSDADRLLYALKVAWNPSTRDRVRGEIRRAKPWVQDTIVAVCANRRHESLAQAIEMVETLGRRDAVPHLRRLAADGPQYLRRPALIAVHRIEPLSREDLERFLRQRDVELILAVLDICREAIDVPIQQICRLLFDADERIRAAARLSIPKSLPQELEQFLVGVVESEEAPGDALIALEALTRCKVTATTERLCNGLLQSDDPPLRLAALRCLANKGRPLTDPGPVWEIATGPSYDPGESASAFDCLERTGSFSVPLLLAEISGLRPEQQFHAARCLVVAGQKAGVGKMLELYEELTATDRGAIAGEDARRRILTSIRRELSRLSGSRASDGLPVWTSWYNQLKTLPPQPLRPAPPGR